MPHTVGREDRVIRGGLALTILLMSWFAAAADQGFSWAALALFLIGAYAAVTAALGIDPVYHRFDLDTRGPRELDAGPRGPRTADPASARPSAAAADPATGGPATIDLRDRLLSREPTQGPTPDPAPEP